MKVSESERRWKNTQTTVTSETCKQGDFFCGFELPKKLRWRETSSRKKKKKGKHAHLSWPRAKSEKVSSAEGAGWSVFDLEGTPCSRRASAPAYSCLVARLGWKKKRGWGGLTQQLNKLFYLESRSHNQTGLKGKLQAHEGGLVSPSSNIFNLGG